MKSSLAIRCLASTLLTLSLAPFSSSHYAHARASTHPSEHVPSRVAFDRSHERDDLGALSEFDERENHTRLEKRGAMTIAYRSNAENADLNHAYQDMVYFVGYIYNNWARVDPNIFETYFHPFHVTKVQQVAYTILRMAQPGGITDMAGNLQAYRPTDLSEILLLREHGTAPNLAQSFNVAPRALDPKIAIYDFGWQVLRNRRFLSDYPADCSKIGSKVDYRMQFLGGLLFHEVLHFYNVGQLAWGTVLQAGEFIDDQEGDFCGSSKAYGPYQARLLREVTMVKPSSTMRITFGSSSTLTGPWCARRACPLLPPP